MRNIAEIKQTVKDKYNQIARENANCCDTECDVTCIGDSYASVEGYVADADLGLGCGLPTQHAGIQPGNVVVDLGSGAGNDVFIARSIVGPEGRVIGIDMAEEMHRKALTNLEKLGFDNVEFRLGEIEDIPLANETADVVVSNCVFNLVPDKLNAFRETYRILKPGGHFTISDIMITGALPLALREEAELYVGCVSGAIDRDAYLAIIRNTGFANVQIVRERAIILPDEVLDRYLDANQKTAFLQSDTGILSVTVTAVKPETGCCEEPCCD